jgi:hypothetical protein
MITPYIYIKYSKPKRDRKGAYITCETCKKEFYVMPERLKRKNLPKFCSQKCYIKTGDKNPFWGKKHTKKSIIKMVNNPSRYSFKEGLKNYNNIRFPETFIGSTPYWWSHHKLRKSKICERCGFDKFEILNIHHKDRNVKNNSIENIEILCPNCHMLEHYNKKDGPFYSI